ncbi:hypothetical protein QTP88_019678 [Uroleucon formosanum]
MKRTKLLIELATQKTEIEKNSVWNIENSPKTDFPEILTDAQYLESSPSSSVTPCCIAEQNESPIKLKLRRLTKQTNYKVIVDDSENEENLSGDDTKSGDNYIPSVSETSSESESTDQLTDLQTIDLPITVSPIKKGKKRSRNPEQWKKTKAKLLKNSGKSYTSRTGKTVNERVMGPNCSDRCILKCSSKSLASLQRQRDYLASCIEPLQLKYRRIFTSETPRRQNCGFYLLFEGNRIRVCKTYMINTFGITERTIRSVIQSRTSGSGITVEDKLESHYQRANTTREFVDGGLSIAEMYRHYAKERVDNGKTVASYFCEGFNNATAEEKAKLEIDYQLHQDEKNLSRTEKANDKEKAKEMGSNIILATFDLQAVMSVPTGQSSAFFYKSRLNCFNFTVLEIIKDHTICYFWHEGVGQKGAIEIGSCLLMFIEEIANSRPGSDIIFYSDNCCGQQKNMTYLFIYGLEFQYNSPNLLKCTYIICFKFVHAMYLYAVEKYQINSITHKYLIRGHTQNEGDTVHSVIEKSMKRSKKSGPIYVPDQLELSFKDFIDLKSLTDEIGYNCQKNTEGEQIKISNIKIIRFVRGSEVCFYKNSYKDITWEKAQMKKAGTRRSGAKDIGSIKTKLAYNSKIPIAENKKKDIQSLLTSNTIPNYYETFYNTLF